MKNKFKWIFYWILPVILFTALAGWKGLLGIALAIAFIWFLAWIFKESSSRAREVVSVFGCTVMTLLGSIALAGIAVTLNVPGALLLGGFLYPSAYAIVCFLIY